MNIFWFVLFVGILILVQMEFFYLVGLRKVDYRRFFSKKAVYEGDKVEMVEVLANRKAIPIPWLRVESRISPWLRFKVTGDFDVNYDQFHRSSFFLRGFKRVTRRHEITCVHRGWYVLRTASLTTGDLFGMLRRSKEITSDEELFVYPRPLGVGEENMSSLKYQGDVTMRRWIQPDPILVNGIREYQPGDPQKDIHWGATARTGTLQVKVRDYTVSPRVMVLLNTQIREDLWGSMDPEQQEIIEYGVRLTSHLCTWAISNGLDAGFASNGQLQDRRDETVYVEPACSQTQLETILRNLAKLDIVRVLNFYTLIDRLIAEGITGLDIAIISAYRSPTLEDRADRLRMLGNDVTFLDIGDYVTPAEGKDGAA